MITHANKNLNITGVTNEVYSLQAIRIPTSLLITFFLFCFTISLGSDQQGRLDSLKARLNHVQGELRFETSFELFETYFAINLDSALLYVDESVQLAHQLGDSLLITRSHNARGWTRYKQSQPALCIPDFEYALGIAKRNSFKDQEKFLLNNLVLAHTDASNFDIALDYSFQSLRIREELKNPLEISIALNNVGIVYLKLADFEHALEYFERSRRVKETNDIKYDLDRCYVNIGIAQQALENFEKALESIDHALQICEPCQDRLQVEAYYGRGLALFELKRFDDADRAFRKALQIAKGISSSKYEALILSALAKIELERKNLSVALNYLDLSQGIVDANSLRDQSLENYQLYISIFNQRNDYKKASEYQQRYIQVNNEIFSSDLIKNISRIQTEHEERENIKTIAAKNQILALQQVIIQRQRDQYVFIVTITVLVVGLAFVLFWSNRSQRKANQALEEAKETIEQQNIRLADSNKFLESEVSERTRELLDSNEALTHANAELDNFIYKTSHDIRGPLASLKGICNVALMDVHDPLATDYLKKLDATATKMNAILSRLLIINQINHSVLSVNDMHLKSLVNDIIDIEVKKGLPAGFKIEVNIPLELTLRSDMGMVKIILENLIDNAVKFRNESGRVQSFVRITAEVVDRWVYVRVKDNGIGIHASEKEKIFNLFSRASEKSESGGVGLYLSKLATIKLGGDIKLHDTTDGTTEFVVSFLEDLEPLLAKRAREQRRLDEEKAKQKGPENS
ncbi:MAG: tetratricopeptide repeat protein [Cyclobacteriaceae bacterium]